MNALAKAWELDPNRNKVAVDFTLREFIDRVVRDRICESEAIVAKQVIPELRHLRVCHRWFVEDGSDRTEDG